MVFTLHRYIFRELLKVFFLAAVALTLILSLGSILRPIQEYGVGPGQVIRLMVYFLPITLTFVLPMAALFASALTYGRFAADNELDACRASGISLFTMVYPGLCLAILVAMTTLILSFYVVPAYVRRAEKVIKSDAKQILFRNIQRKGYYNLPDGKYRIFADAVDPQEDQLIGAVVAKTKGGEIKQLITAERAEVRFGTSEQFNEVTVIAHKVYKIDAESSVYLERLPISTEFGSLLTDNIKFKKIREMKAIRADYMRFYPVASQARAAYAQLAAELLAESISSKIVDRQDRFYRLNGKDYQSGKTFYIDFTAAQCRVDDETTVHLVGEIAVLQYDAASQQLVSTWQCNDAVLELIVSGGRGLPSGLAMTVRNASRQQSDPPQADRAWRHTFRDLDLPDAVADKLTPDVLASINSAAVYLKNPQEFTNMRESLQEKIEKTVAQIKAEVHSRMVFGLGCISMILISIALGIKFKGGHLLSAFGASSVPAAIMVVCIMMGRNITKNPLAQTISGVGLIWASFAAFAVFTVVLYRKLLKN